MTVEGQDASGSVAAAEQAAMGAWLLRRPTDPIVRGEGSWLVTASGQRLLDLTAGYGTCPLGHCHPRLVAALEEQARTLWSAPGFLLADVRGRYVQALQEVLPPPLERVFLVNSGTEAVEAGLKFARLETGRRGVVALRGSFHGRTLGALAATSNKKAREPESVLDSSSVRFVRRDDVEALDEAVDDDCAVVLLEVVQGEGGVFPCAPRFLEAAREIATERGALLMVDEIQTGFGRTGSLFASAAAGLAPDLMSLAKGMAGGFPAAALAYSAAVEEALSPGAHGSTFGGNALACAAGLALLEALDEEDVVAQVAELGDWLLERLEAQLGGLAKVREIRGRGLMFGIQLRERAGRYVAELTRDRGVLVLPAGPNVIRLLPPLNATRAELQLGVDALQGVLEE